MSRVWQLVRPKKVVASTAALVMVVSLVNLSGLVPLEAEAAVAAEPTPAPTTISLTTSRTVVAAGQTARLVATVDNAVQDSSSVIEIIDTNTNGVVALCSKGRSCTQDVSIDTGGPHTYLARVGSIESELVTIERETWTVELSASRSTLLAGQSSTLEAVASQSVGKTNNAFAIYIFDTTNGTLIATCAGGKTCKATVPTLYDGDGGRARSFVAVVASTGNPARLEDAENIQATSTTVGIERVPWVLSLRSSATEVVVGGSAKITAVANQDVADTMGQYSLYIVDVQNDDRVVECATGRRCRMTVTWAELGQAQSLAAFIAAPGAQSFDDLQDIQAGSDAVHLEQTPWSVALTSNRDTAGAGDLILVKAETNQNLSRASGAYSTYIFEASTDQLVKRCEVGTVCVVTDRLFGPEDDLFSGRLYHAVVGLTAEAPSPDDVQDVRALSNWVTVDRVPWTLTVTRGDDVLLPDGKVQFTAATNQSLDKTFGRDAIYFFDAESGEVLGECLTGTGCVAAVSGNLPAGRSVFAVVAERTQPGSFDEARSIQASSNAVTTTDTFWSVSLETNTPVFAAGASATLTATANHDLDATFKNYEIAIFDTTSGTVVKRCVSGTTCSVETSFGAGGPHRYQAIIAAAGATTVEAAIDLQAVSEVVELTREPWKITLTANKAELLAGETAVVTAVANQDIGATNGQYQLTIFDETTGIAVKTCQSTTICVWEPQSLYFADGLHDYVALLMDAAYVNRIENATGVQATSNELSFEIAPWTLSLVADVREFVAGEYGRITASGNQNIGLTGGSLAIYYFDKSDGGKRVGDCTELGFSSSGTNRCSASVSFYDSQSHTFVAVVAKKTNPATLDDAVGVLVTSNTVQVSNAPWSAHLTATPYGSGYVRLVAGANQSPWRTNGTYSLYIVRATGVSSYCNPYLTCDVFVGLNSGESFTAVVASADPPYLHNVLARSATFFAPVTGGPTDVGETAGGGNPSESNCQCSHGDPVNTATGEFYHPEQDLSIPGVGPALGVQRTYSSTYASVDGPFGYGWSTNFSSNLTVVEEGNAFNGLPLKVRIIQENGSSVTFTRDSGGEYRAPLRVQATLTFDEAQQTWTFIRHRTQVFEYDAHGRLSAVKDLNGNAVTLSHDSAGNVVGLSASGGRSVALTWEGGHVSQIADSAGRTVHYSYDEVGNLAAVVAADQRVTRYGYDSGHYMTTVVSPGGATLHNAYDSSHRVVQQTDPLGRLTTFAYAGLDRTISSPGGGMVEETYNATKQLVSQTFAVGTSLARTSTFTYDNANNLETVTNALGEATTKTYDQYGDVVSQTDSAGNSVNWTYDALGNATSATDALGRHSTATYSPTGDLLTTTSQSGFVQTWAYNSNGTLSVATDGNGHETTFGYDSAGRLNSTTDADGRTSTVVFGDDGIVTVTTDSAGNATHQHSDPLGRPLSITGPDGATTQFGYDAAGDLTSLIDALGGVTSTTRDLLGRVTEQTDASGGITSTTYTPAGEIAAVTDPADRTTTYVYDILGQLSSVTDANGHATSYSYDAVGRPLTRTLPSGATSTLSYDELGQIVSAIDAKGNATGFSYDAAGQRLTETDALGRVTTARYGPDGELVSTELPSGAVVKHSYDATGRLVKFTNADGKAATYSYSDSGLLLKRIEPGGLLTQYDYDSAGRLHDLTRPDGSSTTFAYDTVGNLLRSHSNAAGAVDSVYEYDALGRLLAMTDRSGTSSYRYDEVGRVLSQTNGMGSTIGYGYDPSGLLTAVDYPGRGAVSYDYDPVGQMASVTDWNGNATAFSWTVDGQLKSRKAPTGVVESRSYDAAGATAEISISSPLGVLASFSYGFDAEGQLTSSDTENAASYSSSFGYDDDGQLSNVSISGDSNSPGGAVLTTPAGLVLSTTSDQTFTYNEAQELVAAGQPGGERTAFGYDLNGARVSATTTPVSGASSTSGYSYDANGFLQSVTTASFTVDYVADSSGLRQSRSVHGGDSQNFLWSTVPSIPLLLDDGEWSYIYGPSSAPVAQISDATGEVQYLYGDIIGSTRLITDDAGAPITTSEYSAFGVRVAHTGTADSAFGYSGNWTDPLTELVYLRARDYDPATAQFLTVDPAVSMTHQPYAYAANNPLLLTDPLGLYACDDFGRNASAFLLGMLDGASFGISSLVLGLVNPEYNKFVEGNAWFYGGMAVGTVLISAATAGVGAAVAATSFAVRGAAAVIRRAAVAGGERLAATGGREAVQSTAAHAGSAILGRTGARGASTETYLFRGVATHHPGYDDAVQGIARPRGGSASAVDHNLGDTRSEFTSWTTDPGVASGFAGNGVVLRVPATSVRGQTVGSPDYFEESEVLLRGAVHGAEVLW